MKQGRRDWFRIIRDLMAAGVSMGEVARKCGRDKQTVRQWAEGSDPKDADARIVLALYARHCPEKYTAHAKEFEIPVPLQRGGIAAPRVGDSWEPPEAIRRWEQRVEVTAVRDDDHPPLRTLTELAEEFGVDAHHLSLIMGRSPVEVPRSRIAPRSRQHGSKVGWYEPEEMRAWWRAHHAVSEAETQPGAPA